MLTARMPKTGLACLLRMAQSDLGTVLASDTWHGLCNRGSVTVGTLLAGGTWHGLCTREFWAAKLPFGNKHASGRKRRFESLGTMPAYASFDLDFGVETGHSAPPENGGLTVVTK